MVRKTFRNEQEDVSGMALQVHTECSCRIGIVDTALGRRGTREPGDAATEQPRG
jgi:hypothetical protein